MSKEVKHKERMITLCFRADPPLIDLFYQECKMDKLTRSDGFRRIFYDYMLNKYFKEQNDESSND